MKITNRKSQLLSISNFNNKFIKTEKIHKVYTDNTNTSEIRYKTVEFRYPDGTINYNKSYDCRLIIDKSDEFDTEYANQEVKILITFDHYDGCKERYKTIKVHTNNTKTPLRKYWVIEYRYLYGTIDKDKSYDYELIFDKIDESDFEYVSPAFKTENVFDLYEMC